MVEERLKDGKMLSCEQPGLTVTGKQTKPIFQAEVALGEGCVCIRIQRQKDKNGEVHGIPCSAHQVLTSARIRMKLKGRPHLRLSRSYDVAPVSRPPVLFIGCISNDITFFANKRVYIVHVR